MIWAIEHENYSPREMWHPNAEKGFLHSPAGDKLVRPTQLGYHDVGAVNEAKVYAKFKIFGQAESGQVRIFCQLLQDTRRALK